MTNFILIAGLLALVIGLYLISYTLNQKTEAPSDDEPMFQCAACASTGSCQSGHHSHHNKPTKKTEIKEFKL